MTQAAEPAPIKAMVSYAWGDAAQQARVKQLVDQLIGDGIDMVFDRYHLREGDDVNAFMEQTAASGKVSKIMAVCDPKYVQRMNTREGGSGQEGMIMSPHVYAQLRGTVGGQDQTRERRFVAVIFDRNPELPRDDPKHLPTMFGSMKYIDMSSPELYDENYDQLLRFLLDKPEFVAPQLGKVPEHLRSEAAQPTPGQSQASTIKRLIDQGRDALPAWKTYLEQIEGALRSIQPAVTEHDGRYSFEPSMMFGEAERLLPLRDLFVGTLRHSLRHGVIPTEALTNFFERLLDLSEHLSQANRNGSTTLNAMLYGHADFLRMELFLYTSAVLVDEQQVQPLKTLTEHTYFEERHGQLRPVTFGDLQSIYEQSRIEDAYNDITDQKWISPIGAWIMARATLQTVPVAALLQADLLLFLKSMRQKMDSDGSFYGYRWGAQLGPYVETRGVPPLFIRWMSRNRLQPWLTLFDVADAEALRGLMKNIFPDDTLGSFFRSQWSRVSVTEFFKTDEWGKLP